MLKYILIQFDPSEPIELIYCSIAAVVIGIIISLIYTYKNIYTKSMVTTLALMPLAVQMVIFLINGNIGAGIAVAGAFSLIRFRSVAGTARDIASVLMTMAMGIACGMGYIGIASLFLILYSIISLILYKTKFGETPPVKKVLKVVMTEDLDYTGVFDDIFKKYTIENELVSVKTVNVNTLFEIRYNITLKRLSYEKKMIDEIRIRNGNLDISCSNFATADEK